MAGRDANGKVIPHERNEEVALVVAHYAGIGADVNYLAVMLNLRPGQIKEHYKNELEQSAKSADLAVIAKAHEMATSGESEGMTKFWLQARAKWRTGDSAEDRGASLFNIHIHA